MVDDFLSNNVKFGKRQEPKVQESEEKKHTFLYRLNNNDGDQNEKMS
jgi:hypothetical protein